MSDIRERLDGSYRLVRFRRMRNRLFVLEVVLLMAVALLYMATSGGSIKPLYIPGDFLLFILLILCLILFTEYVYFKTIEINASRSNSGKFLVARNTIRDCTAIAVVAIILMSLAVLPQMIRAGPPVPLSETASISQNQNWSVDLMTRDMLGSVDADTLTVASTQPTYLLLYVDGAPPINFTLDQTRQINLRLGTDYPGFHRLRMEVRNPGSSTNIRYEMSYTRSPLLYQFTPILAVAIIVVAGAGLVIMTPIKGKYSSGSIYSIDYKEQVVAGSERMEDRLALDKTLSEAEIVEEIAPPPPEPTAQTAPVVEAEKPMARRKGVVDEPAPGRADVPCPSCRQMNSPDSGMCFSCGAILAPQAPAEVEAVDHIERARRFLDSGRYEDAISSLDSILRTEHENHEALFMKAQALRGLRRHELAIQYLNTVIQARPDHRDALMARGRTFEDMNLLERAIENYRKAMAIAPDEDLSKRLDEIEGARKEETLNQFRLISGVGEAKANALYDAGYRSVNALANAKAEELTKTKGINEKLARRILKHFGKE
ncbi:MAG: tetratricopeptide repeat protein [Euryarchaeota archaeon]|nr:tetratricopeptide repeat protein [Euryarchaeota archaeon]